jgi:hypothetical protein
VVVAVITAMPRQPPTILLNPEPSYPAWKAAAVKALAKLHKGCCQGTRARRESIWTRAAYVYGSISPRLPSWPLANDACVPAQRAFLRFALLGTCGFAGSGSIWLLPQDGETSGMDALTSSF